MDPVSRDDLAGFCVFQTQIRSKKFEKTGPDPESLVIFGSQQESAWSIYMSFPK